MRQALPLLPLLLIACGDHKAPNKVEENSPVQGLQVAVEDLFGDWLDVQDSGRTQVHEHWERDPNGTPVGLGYVLSGKDTVFIEHLALVRHDDTLNYAVSIGHDGGGPVLFKLTHDRDSLVFENPQHDMPQRIVYIPDGRNAWHVIVSGTNKGRTSTDHYRFKRVIDGNVIP
ncbi:MAG: hypothetical protein H6590_07740 [Flavobacteriales bacterium]|nr:hypothetical protein [Flavobacteriales bacterium]